MKFQMPASSQPAPKNWCAKFSNKLIKAVLFFLLMAVSFSAGAWLYHSGWITSTRAQVVPAAGKFIAEVNSNVQNELRLYQDNGLPTLTIDLKFKYYREMLEKRDEALRVGILQTSDNDFVPATIALNNGRKMDSEIRLKGDWTDHLEGKKWSFRIHLKGDDDQILGFRQFSIQTPETRNFLNEWGIHQNLMKEDILTTRYDFVNVMLNGELLGIYAIEENFTGELIESQGRRQGVIIRFDEDNLWDKWAYFYANGIKFTGNGWSYTTEQSADITPFQSGKIAADPVLSAEAETARSLLYSFESGALPASEVFDVQLMGRFFAISDLWAACHGATWHNMRFYYNPITARLEPVVFDAIPFSECKQDSTNQYIFDAYNNIFDDDDIKRAYAAELYRITRPGYIQTLKAEFDTRAQEYTNALKVEYDQKGLNLSWQKLIERQEFLELWFNTPTLVKGSYQVSGINPGDTVPPAIKIELTNLASMPVDVLGFTVDNKPLTTGSTLPVELTSYKNAAQVPNFQIFELPLADTDVWSDLKNPPEIEAVIRLGGFPYDTKVSLDGVMTPEELNFGPLPSTMTLNEITGKYPFISSSPAGDMLVVSPGIWNITGDLVLPENVTLLVQGGTALQFEEGSVLLVRGALNFSGEADDPILLTSSDGEKGWGGIVVLNSNQDSTWKYTKVENTHGISRKGWILTGGITFFNSNITLDNSIIGNNQTEDAINVVHGIFTFKDTMFENTFADAFDSDFSEGVIKNCTFLNIAGDAVDVSGTKADLIDLQMERIGDKGLSVGENSHLIAANLVMTDVGIGVASKDLSMIEIRDTTITNAKFAGLAAYIKKPVFGPGTIIADNVVIEDSFQACIAQTGSNVQLNGVKIQTQEVDVDRLYAEGILGN